MTSEIIKIIADNLSLDENDIEISSDFDDLQMDDLDITEIIMSLEQAFDIVISDEDISEMLTISDIVDAVQKAMVAE